MGRKARASPGGLGCSSNQGYHCVPATELGAGLLLLDTPVAYGSKGTQLQMSSQVIDSNQPSGSLQAALQEPWDPMIGGSITQPGSFKHAS